MVPHEGDSHRIDPYLTFPFRLFCNGRPVAAVSKVSSLKRAPDVIKHREGGDSSTSRCTPGGSVFEPITLERGIIHDSEFLDWAGRVYSAGGDEVMNLANMRRDITIKALDEQGATVRTYKIRSCWVSDLTVHLGPTTNASGAAVESAVLQNEGWEFDQCDGAP